MQPTRLAFYLFCAGFIPQLVGIGLALFGYNTTWIHVLVVGFDIGLLALFGLDAILGTSQLNLQVQREKPARLSVGIDNEVALVIENRGRRRLELVLRDEAPAGFRVEP